MRAIRNAMYLTYCAITAKAKLDLLLTQQMTKSCLSYSSQENNI